MTTRLRLIAAFAPLLLSTFLDGCSLVNRTPLPPAPSEKKVLAFYYPWYGAPTGPSREWVHWDPQKPRYTSTNTPLAGYYDSRDDGTIERHIREAKQAGIDAFISSWWGIGTFEDLALERLLADAERNDFQVSVYYEEARSGDQIYQDLRYLLSKYGQSPAFLKVRGRPVIFFYARAIALLAPKDWAELLQRLDREGLALFSIADGFQEDLTGAFDGVHLYNPVRMNFRYLWELYLRAAPRVKAAGKLFAATVVPGYDDRYVRQPGFARGRQDGRYYRAYWDAATDSDPHWILITSFNEWHEGSEIEPSVEFGDEYLKLTRQLADKWKNERR
jgi:glycoprotein endo-alpha-1,2-mannosidase